MHAGITVPVRALPLPGRSFRGADGIVSRGRWMNYRLDSIFTQRSRYALRALIFLARTASVAPVPISVIAADQKLPRKFLEIILLDLKNGGLVVSYRGKMGGYRFARAPRAISFREMIHLIEGSLALVPCVSVTKHHRCADCFDETTCVIRKVMLTLREGPRRNPQRHDARRHARTTRGGVT